MGNEGGEQDGASRRQGAEGSGQKAASRRQWAGRSEQKAEGSGQKAVLHSAYCLLLTCDWLPLSAYVRLASAALRTASVSVG